MSHLKRCSAPGCEEYKDDFITTALFRFPKDPARCRTWVQNCGNRDLLLLSVKKLHMIRYLCLKHFEPQHFFDKYRRKLHRNAEPTIFSGSPIKAEEMAEFDRMAFDAGQGSLVNSAFPSGKVPTLEVDGQIIDQSKAIGRYLAKKVGLMGKDDWENILIDSVVDTFDDFRIECAQYAYEPDPKVKTVKQEKLWKETVPFYMNKLDELAKENGGYLACGKLTWADVYVAGMHETYILYSGQNLLEGRPHLKSVVDKVYAIPAIKAIIDKRPPDEEF